MELDRTGHRERRMVPTLISIVCYFLVCFNVMEWLRYASHFMSVQSSLLALLVQIVCALD